jgi:uncharacterized protein YjbI with pentapeptide repeats
MNVEQNVIVEQTLARWGEGKESWNEWAEDLLRQKGLLIEAGEWVANPFGEGENAATREWLEAARADFSQQIFPETVHFGGYIFPGPVSFSGCAFSAGASFEDAHFEGAADFTGMRAGSGVSFKRAAFSGIADFDGSVFGDEADFEHARFAMECDGPLVICARFSRCTFEGRADFRSTEFAGNVKFARTDFAQGMRFDEARLAGAADFSGVSVAGIAAFAKTQFAGETDFTEAHLRAEARFMEARFNAAASFQRVWFGADALFRDAAFNGETGFTDARFGRPAVFMGAAFAVPACFARARFKDSADFSRARLMAPARFRGVRFDGPAGFAEADFAASADFSEARVDSTMNIAGASFASAPDFIDARFAKPVRLDNLSIGPAMRRFRRWRADGRRDPRLWVFRLMKVARDEREAGRLRQLRHLARDSLDHGREGAFYAAEMRASRFWIDKPLGRGAGRFWLGWLYGGIANYGRSVLRPVGLWALTTLAFAFVYLGLRETPAVAPPAPIFPDWPAQLTGPALLAWAEGAGEWVFQSIANRYASAACSTGNGSASAEALYLAFKNSLFFVPWESPLAAQRVYGCLYGMADSAPVVPFAASVTALAQNVIGVVLIALAVLGLRNLLKRG